MISKVYSAIPTGYDGKIIEVEGDKSRGLPAFFIVGMANKTVSEAKERVRSALRSSDFVFPDQKITINLAPAELAKDGTYLDLSIALSVLILSQQLLPADVKNRLFIGELSLDGSIRPVRGIINVIECAKQAGFKEVYLPLNNLNQATLIPGIKIIGVATLKQLFFHLKNIQLISTPTHQSIEPIEPANELPTLDQIRGQDIAKRALNIAVAGHHNILLFGPPGSGKTLLAQTAANLLPPPTKQEQLDITKIYSLAGLSEQVISTRPFRSPHHTSSSISLIGGGAKASPGEISLAHHGVLFLDELPEFSRDFLEALRQPLEDHIISISRAKQKTTYPADFMLIATMNPCPCGFYQDPSHPCNCTPAQIQNYRKKLSGPLLDRIDLTINVQKVPNQLLLVSSINQEHNVVKNTITDAIKRQHQRFGTEQFNSRLSPTQIAQTVHLTKGAKDLLSRASERLGLSARSYFKIIKVAQTIADLDVTENVGTKQISEALSYRDSI